MFKVAAAVATQNNTFVFVRSAHGPEGYVNAEWVISALRAIGIDFLDTRYAKALVELADYLRENEL